MKNKQILLLGSRGYVGKYLLNAIKDADIISINHYTCDLCVQSDLKKLQKTLSSFTRIDAVINCVGKVNLKRFEEYSIEEVRELLNKNFMTVYNILKIIIPIFKKQKQGKFINVSSIRGITGAPNRTIYSASKFAVQGLIDSLRLELKDTNIKLTNICPGKLDDSVTREDISKTVNYLLNLSDKTYVRNIILGGTL
ncbi:MAG: SDR family NAD(P)-dependent oxidoreductase [Atribacterota bacterium]